MINVVERVEKLIALALNNSCDEEARSAATKAVRLIKQHQLVVLRTTVAP